MDVLLEDDEREVAEQARVFLAEACPPALVRACESQRSISNELWQQIVRLGWLDTSLPEDVGGLGLPLHYLGLLFEQAGRVLAPVPLASVMVPLLILAKHAAQHADVLRRVRAGKSILSYAVQEQSGAWSLDAVRMAGRVEGDSIVLRGSKHFVDNFALSSHCLVAFRVDGALTLALVDTAAAGIAHTDLVSTAKDSHASVHFDNVRVSTSAVVGRIGGAAAAVSEVLDLATLFCTAQLVGAARRATEFAVTYANERIAFEQPVGAFQAIQHLCADMLIGIDGAELLCREATWTMGRGRAAGVEVAQAKAFANEKCLMACRSAQQIHGGIGFIMEFDLQLWYRRVVSWSLRCGTTQEQRRRVADSLLPREGKVRLDTVAAA